VSRNSFATVLSVVAAALGIVAVITRPFLFAPIGFLLVMIAVRLTADRRFTRPATVIVILGAFAGASLAAAMSNPLY